MCCTLGGAAAAACWLPTAVAAAGIERIAALLGSFDFFNLWFWGRPWLSGVWLAAYLDCVAVLRSGSDAASLMLPAVAKA